MEVRPGPWERKLRWHFGGQRWEWLDGCVAWSEKIEFQVKGWGRLGLDDIISVLQQNRLQWYGYVLQKEDYDWVKKCMEYEVEGARPRGNPQKTWSSPEAGPITLFGLLTIISLVFWIVLSVTMKFSPGGCVPPMWLFKNPRWAPRWPP